jgi:hypothetical protein
VRSRSEYTYHDVVDNDDIELNSISMPVFAGGESAALMSDHVTRSMAQHAKTEQGSKAVSANQAEFGSNLPGNPKEGRGTPNTTSKTPSKTVPETTSEPRAPDELNSEIAEKLEQMDELLLQVVNGG